MNASYIFRLSANPLLIIFSALTVISPAIAIAAEGKRAITAEDFFTIKQVDSPRISPDGAWVAYTVKETDLQEDKTETRLWMVSTDDGEVIQMTGVGNSASQPRWSPDGKYLGFLSARNDGESQVWALNRKGGEAIQITYVEQGVSSFYWSPDGSQLALLIIDPEPESEGDDDQGDDSKPWVIDRLQFKRDYAGYLDRRRTHLYLQIPGDTDLTQLTFGDYDDAQPAWSPDGKYLAFVSNRTENPDANSNRDIWVVEVEYPGEAELLQLTSNPGSDFSPSWSPDGQFITYVTVTEPDLIWYATNHLATVSSAGGTPRVLTSRLDRNVSSPRYSADGDSINFIWEESGERHLASIDPSGESFARLISGQRSIRNYSTHESGLIAALIGEAHQPAEIFLADNGTLEQLTFTNRAFLEEVELAAVEKVRFNSQDGTEIEGFVYKPANFDPGQRYPTLLRIHGGPVAQYDFNFNFDAQLFAAKGYVVVMVNPRGSSGYGQNFSLGIYQNWGTKDFEDVMAGVDYVIDQGFADPDRLGVGGWSYGGILTNYVITKTDRFKAAISGASEVLFRSNYGHDHYQLQWEKELGLPWENAQAWERISPFNDVAEVTTPTLIMGGEKDWNVPILNSEQLYQALKRLGVTTQLVVYPGEHHGISKPSFILDRYQRYIDWYGTHVTTQN